MLSKIDLMAQGYAPMGSGRWLKPFGFDFFVYDQRTKQLERLSKPSVEAAIQAIGQVTTHVHKSGGLGSALGLAAAFGLGAALF